MAFDSLVHRIDKVDSVLHFCTYYYSTLKSLKYGKNKPKSQQKRGKNRQNPHFLENFRDDIFRPVCDMIKRFRVGGKDVSNFNFPQYWTPNM